MVRDEKQWGQGIAKLGGMMKFRRPPFDEDVVAEFHEIIGLLEAGSGEDLSHFRIGADKLKPRAISSQTISYNERPGRVQYADKKACEDSFFRSQLSSLADYIPSIGRGKSEDERNPYEALNDSQLMSLLAQRGLKPKRVTEHGEDRYVFDRAHAIASLFKDDRPAAPPAVSHVYNIRDSNFVQGSPGSAINQSIGLKDEGLRKILTTLKELVTSQALPPEDRAQMDSDIGTIEMQMNSPRPNKSIIRECLESAKSTIEIAVGDALGVGIVFAIKHYLGIP